MKHLKILLFISLLFSFVQARSHDDISHRIREKTIEILKTPNNPILYLERGYLYQHCNQFQKAITDYLESENLGLNNQLLHFRKAEAYLGKNMLEDALISVDISLGMDLINVKTHKLKSKVLVALKQYKKAKESYDYVLKYTTDLKPENYIDYCTIILSINPTNYQEAIKTLDIAIEKSGTNVVIFQLKKLEYLKESNQVEKVVSLYNRMIKEHKRKEFLYYKKAKYLLSIGDKQGANIAIQQSKLAISELSSKYLNTKSINNLQIDLQNLANQL